MSIRQILIILAVLTIISCKEQSVTDATTAEDKTPKVLAEPMEIKVTEAVMLEAAVNDLKIRAQAGLKGKEVIRIAKGDKLTFQGGLSDMNDKIELRGEKFNELWLSVKTADDKEGWVYGGAVTYDTLANANFFRQMNNKKVLNEYGTRGLLAVQQYQLDFDNIKTEADFAVFYRSMPTHFGNIDSLTMRTAKIRTNEYGDMFFGEHFWIQNTIPGGVLSFAAEGTAYEILRELQPLINKAKSTTGTADDEFMALMKLSNSYGTEDYFKSWFVQTWDYGGYSLLGEGIHTRVIQKIEACLSSSQVFKEEIEGIKADLLSDMLDREEYGKSKKEVLKELNDIITASSSIFTDAEMEKLKARKVAFENGKKLTFGAEQ